MMMIVLHSNHGWRYLMASLPNRWDKSGDTNCLFDMECSKLNLAHQQQRKADHHLNSGRYEDAIECHKKAADLIQEALNKCRSSRVCESLQLQLDYHLRQEAIIRHKQNQAATLKKNKMHLMQLKTTTPVSVTPVSKVSVHQPVCIVKEEIFSKIDENDSLLQFLCNRNQCEIADDPSSSSVTSSTGSKAPKDDTMVIEELRMNNAELRKLVDQLINDKIRLEEENRLLHAQLLEKRQCYEFDESSDKTILSPATDYSSELPTLAALEVPNFDFPVTKSSS